MSPDKAATPSAKKIPPKAGKAPTVSPQPAQQYTIGTLRTEFYYDQYYFIAFMTLCLIMIAGGVVLWGIFEKTLQDIPNQGIIATQALKNSNGNTVVAVGDSVLKFPTTVDGKLVFPMPLSEPGFSTPALLEWAVEAVASSYSFNFINYEQIISNSAIYYTKAGYQNYRRSLIENNIANSVDRKKYILSAVPTSAPVITKEKPTPDGIYNWQLQFPIQMVYQNVREVQRSDWIVTLSIIRVPTTEAPDGLAIAAMIVREGKLNN